MPRIQLKARTKPSATDKEESFPKTTRPEPAKRRSKPTVTAAMKAGKPRRDAFPDRVDVRDWIYRPTLQPIPDEVSDLARIPKILDQGSEGACTGFALAGVLNLLLHARKVKRFVSPYMLYDMARRYDEWPGQDYDGSSARGAIKGFLRHGVCPESLWASPRKADTPFSDKDARAAALTPGGAYFRIQQKEIRDVHAAIAEVGAVFATFMVHAGWDDPGPATAEIASRGAKRRIPIIARKGRAEEGHAVALVGYTRQGFLVQNSWGPGWGNQGIALLPYEDYLLHVTDVWVVQMGVPVDLDIWNDKEARDTTAGLHRAAAGIPLAAIRPYVINIGNNGELSRSGDYWTTEADLKELFQSTIPAAAGAWKKKRIMLYLHGGLNSEAGASQRIVAFRDVFLQNQIYPLHVMWESGWWEITKSSFWDLFTSADERAGAAWLDRFREGLIEAKDRSWELTMSLPGTRMWREMKENAALASRRDDGLGAMQRVAAHVAEALKGAAGAAHGYELHIVAHSAGSIFVAHALEALLSLGIPLATLQFMAPAITVDLFKSSIFKKVQAGECPHPTLYVLSDVGERDDEVGPYGKSLLYLVSNAFEGRRDTRLLGMEKYISKLGEAGAASVDAEMDTFFKRKPAGLPSLVVAGRTNGVHSISRSDTHGGFDNDPDTLNSVMGRILGRKPDRLFVSRDLQF